MNCGPTLAPEYGHKEAQKVYQEDCSPNQDLVPGPVGPGSPHAVVR